MRRKNILVTGGSGFIGTNFIRHTLKTRPEWKVVNLDALTYAGNPANLDDLDAVETKNYKFVKGDIKDSNLLNEIFEQAQFDGVINFAAESHVDRSIVKPDEFISTNVIGTFQLLEVCRTYCSSARNSFRFIHVSTDEVFGSLGNEGYFTETTPYNPSSPYSASKAASDHFVNAYFCTYGLPAIITNCSNNYGPYQFPEKLIPLMILNIIKNKSLPIYGNGKNIRDWLYVIDHCEAIIKVFEEGVPGETYNIGGNAESQNIDIVHLLCKLLDERLKRTKDESSLNLIEFVTDRPGHDKRYAIDPTKIREELGWKPRFDFMEGIKLTVDWYLNNMKWVESVRSGKYRNWIDTNYKDRGRISKENVTS